MQAMATAIFLRLRDGRAIRFGHALDAAGAAKLKADVEHWIATGITLSVGSAQGVIEEVAARSVEGVELVVELMPGMGGRTPSSAE